MTQLRMQGCTLQHVHTCACHTASISCRCQLTLLFASCRLAADAQHRHPWSEAASLCRYHLDASVGFTSGQRAYSDFFELSDRKALVDQMNKDALTQGTHCRRAQGQYDVCFFTCLKYNFWEDCAAAPGMQVTANAAADYTRVGVKVLHFIAYRKLGMGVRTCTFLAALKGMCPPVIGREVLLGKFQAHAGEHPAAPATCSGLPCSNCAKPCSDDVPMKQPLRKIPPAALQEVYEAFMKSGQEGAHKAYAQLPHTEAGFQDSSRFATVA